MGASEELLRLLIEAADFLETLVGDEDFEGRLIIDEDDDLLRQMRNAIAKATGEA